MSERDKFSGNTPILSDREINDLYHSEASSNFYSAREQEMLNLYILDTRSYPRLPNTEINRLIRLSRSGDIDARNMILLSNLRLIVSVAKRYVGRGLRLLDLVQEGNVAMIVKVIPKYDPDLGLMFSTFATKVISRRLRKAIPNKGFTIRASFEDVRDTRLIKNFSSTFLATYGREPSDDEIHSNFKNNISRGKIVELKTKTLPLLRLQARITNDDEDEFQDLIPDSNSMPVDEYVEENEKRAKTRDVVNSLSPLEANILNLHFGIGNGNGGLKQTEIAQKLGISRSTVQKTEVRAKDRIRTSEQSTILKEFIGL